MRIYLILETRKMSNLSNSQKLILQWNTVISLQCHFSLSNYEISRLIGMSESEYQDSFIRFKAILSDDQLDRLSYLMSIRTSLLNIFSKDDNAYDWIRLPSSDIPFKGKQPLDFMLEDGQGNLIAVARYLKQKANQ